MDKYLESWISFGFILLATGSVVLCFFYTILGLRWHFREKRMNIILDSLSTDPYMITNVVETKTMLDCKVGDFRQIAIT